MNGYFQIVFAINFEPKVLLCMKIFFKPVKLNNIKTTCLSVGVNAVFVRHDTAFTQEHDVKHTQSPRIKTFPFSCACSCACSFNIFIVKTEHEERARDVFCSVFFFIYKSKNSFSKLVCSGLTKDGRGRRKF